LSTITDIGTLISRQPDIHGGCPIIAGTGVTVRRIAIWYKQRLSAEEIADRIEALSCDRQIQKQPTDIDLEIPTSESVSTVF
jgi:uncharacterized protein (DUF433 family)